MLSGCLDLIVPVNEVPAYTFAGCINPLLLAGLGIGSALAFARESRLEVRKVVWPTRQEAIQTTLIVLAVTAVMGLLLFVLDGALVWLVNLITGV